MQYLLQNKVNYLTSSTGVVWTGNKVDINSTINYITINDNIVHYNHIQLQALTPNIENQTSFVLSTFTNYHLLLSLFTTSDHHSHAVIS